jgi:hypothetical protein
MRFYQDISHFRAPYKNYQTIAGFGVVDTGAAAAPPVADPIGQVTVLGEDGILRFNAASVTFIRNQMLAFQAVGVSESVIKIKQYDEQLLAQAAQDATVMENVLKGSVEQWIREKIAAGFAIYAPLSILWPSTATATESGIQIAAVPASDYAQAKEWSKLKIGAFVADPKDGWKTSGIPGEIIPAGIADPKHALIALAIVGGAGLVFFGISKVMKRRGYGRPALAGSLAR